MGISRERLFMKVDNRLSSIIWQTRSLYVTFLKKIRTGYFKTLIMTTKLHWLSSKWSIFFQLLIAVFFVLAANLYDLVPVNETPYIVIMAILSMKLQKQGWKQLGFTKPKSWKKTISVALCIAVGMQLLDAFLLEDLVFKITGSKPDLSGFESIHGNTELLIVYFLLIWTLAAFGEEISYRGFIMTKIAELFGSTRIAWIVGILICSFLFGIAHSYKGLAGMIDSGTSGLIFGTLFWLSRRNLWVCILAHGFVDTYGLLYFYFGFYT